MSPEPTPRITLIVARAHHGVIGRDNQLPWRLPEDLRHFKATTLGHTLVMGRRTFESIGRPLPGRRTVVLSHDRARRFEGCDQAASLSEALAAIAARGETEIFIAGGAKVYAQALALAHRLLITEIDLEVDGDAHFPDFDPRDWPVHSREERTAADGTRFAIVDHRRRA